MSEPFRLLVVCTANHCRSPLLEFALRRRCHLLGLGWTIGSAGTAAREGQPVHRQVARLLHDNGDDPTGWGARRLTADLLEAADLVLAAELANRNDVVRLLPAAARRTFLVIQLAEHWGAGTVVRAPQTSRASLRSAVRRARHELPATQAAADLRDPERLGRRAFDQLGAQVDDLVKALLGG